MDVGARRAAGHGVTERYEWNPLGPKISHQSLALRAIGMDGDVHRVMVIESEVVVDRRLAKGADGQPAGTLTRRSGAIASATMLSASDNCLRVRSSLD